MGLKSYVYMYSVSLVTVQLYSESSSLISE